MNIFTKKYWASVIFSLMLCLSFSTAIAVDTQGDFSDTTSHWSRYYASNLRDYCQLQGFLSPTGSSLNLFKPDQNVTRAELVKMVLQCKYGPNFAYMSSANFPDVASDSWAAPYIAEALHTNLVSGYSDGSFRPNQPVTRAEALKIILRAKYAEESFNSTTGLNFTDTSASAWYAKYLSFAISMQFINGYSDHTFRPDRSITRAEAAKIINLVSSYPVKQEQVVQPPATPPVDNGSTTASNGSPMIAGCAIFPSDNPWNRDISQLPVDANSANYINSIGAADHLHPDFGSPAEYGIPYVVVDGNTTPKVQVNAEYADESDFGLAPIPANPPIEGTYASDGDRHVIVLDKVNCLLYETWSSYFEGGVWNVGSAAKFDLNSNALRPDGWTSADAAGLPILPGLVRYDEVQAGAINHALRFTVSQTQAGYMHPATHEASSSTDANRPPMGLRLRLKANYDISGFSAESQVILQALKKYGMIVADNGSDWFISGESNANWNDEAINQLKQVPGSAFEVVDMGEIIRH